MITEVRNGVVVPVTQETIDEVEASRIPFVTSEPKQLSKATFLQRMSLDESYILEEALPEENSWMRTLYQSVQVFDESNGLVDYLKMLLGRHLESERVEELLALEI